MTEKEKYKISVLEEGSSLEFGTVKDSVESVLCGYNSTIISCGFQIHWGKIRTLYDHVIPSSIVDLFQTIGKTNINDTRRAQLNSFYCVRVNFSELGSSGDILRNLLDNPKLDKMLKEVKELYGHSEDLKFLASSIEHYLQKVVVEGGNATAAELNEYHSVTSIVETLFLMVYGKHVLGKINPASNTHSFFTVYIETHDADSKNLVGKLQFVDLQLKQKGLTLPFVMNGGIDEFGKIVFIMIDSYFLD